MVSAADAVVADLSPFRGPHIDDGTAVEIGYAVARGIPVFAYADDLRPLASRIARDTSRAGMVDRARIAIEHFEEPFNAIVAGVLDLCCAIATGLSALNGISLRARTSRPPAACRREG